MAMSISHPFVLAAALLGVAAPALAHDPGLSSTIVRRDGDGLRLELRFHAGDLALALPAVDRNGDGRLDAEEIARASESFAQFARRWFALTDGDRRLMPQLRTCSLAANGDVLLSLAAPAPHGCTLGVTLGAIDELPRGHRHYVAVAGIGDDAGVLLHAGALRTRLDLARCAGPGRSAASFVGLGVEHILLGYDHILFLLSLLLAAPGWLAAARLVTAFTLAHSLTLAAATLDLIALPPAIVEPAIAASIVWVAAENLVRKTPRHRKAQAFAFGLVHGLGFATVLRELGIGAGGSAVPPLLAFNAGVELGQLGLALPLLPLLLWARRRPWFAVHGQRLLCATIGCCGLWWLAQRTLLA